MTDPTLNSTQDNAHPDTLLSALQRYHSGGDKTQLRAALQRYNNRFSGPLPDPETLSRYASVDKTLPDRIVTMAEKQQKHAIDIEKFILDHNEITPCAHIVPERRHRSHPPHISKRRIIFDAFSSFTLFPVRSYQRNLPVRKRQSDAEAIASYWRATGEYLSHAMIQHILNEEDKTNGA